jgi:hypothetical protein
MSGEAKLQLSLQIDKFDTTGLIPIVTFRSYPTQFTATVTGAKGPAPGAFAVSVHGTDVDFSELATPGLCRIYNQDPTNYVSYGIADPETDKFYPLGEILPGEFYLMRLSRLLGQEYAQAGTGTGTTGAVTNTMRFMADTAPCNVVVEAFEA